MAQRKGKQGSGRPGGRERADRRPTEAPRASYRPERGEIVVNGYSESWLKRGFPWVYPAEVEARGKGGGQRVRVLSAKGELLGSGIADEGWIAARVYRHDGGPLDKAWAEEALDRAAALRDAVVDPGTTGYRLVHGENDDLPGLRIDWWGHFAVVILDSPAVAPLLEFVLPWLESRRSPRGVYLCYRPDSRDDRDFSAVEPVPGWVAGREPTSPVRVTERGMAMLVRPGEGPDVGMYADMRDVRAWLEPSWGGRAVLNTFCYTGAFSVAAALGGASHVTSVDLSSRYLERAEENFVANELDPALHDFFAEDTFKALDRLRRQGSVFDTVVLDPPSFSHSKEGVWSAKKDYPRLVNASCRVLAEGGWLVAATNQGEMSPRDFRGYVTEGARRAGCRAQELFFAGQGPDFPSAAWFPEGRYLKVGVWRMLR